MTKSKEVFPNAYKQRVQKITSRIIGEKEQEQGYYEKKKQGMKKRKNMKMI